MYTSFLLTSVASSFHISYFLTVAPKNIMIIFQQNLSHHTNKPYLAILACFPHTIFQRPTVKKKKHERKDRVAEKPTYESLHLYS